MSAQIPIGVQQIWAIQDYQGPKNQFSREQTGIQTIRSREAWNRKQEIPRHERIQQRQKYPAPQGRKFYTTSKQNRGN
jgi:hypothetical protein